MSVIIRLNEYIDNNSTKINMTVLHFHLWFAIKPHTSHKIEMKICHSSKIVQFV